MTNLSKNKSGFARLRNTFRQWMFPPEFRIAEGVWSEKIAEQLAEALAALPVTVNNERQDLADKHLAAIGTRLWQLRTELLGNEEGAPPDTHRRAARHLEVLWDRFAEAGLDIDDLKDVPVPEGDSALKIIAYQPTSRVTCNRVIDTVKPMIKFNKKIIQVGEVIVGTPEKSD
jgi:hypothetical protein